MDIKVLEQLLGEVKDGQLSVAQAVERLRTLPFEDLGFARVDHHRQLRQGFPEVVLAEGKSLEQVRGILQALTSRAEQVLVTRLSADKAAGAGAGVPPGRILPRFPGADPQPGRNSGPGPGGDRGPVRRHLGYPGGRRGASHGPDHGAPGRTVYDVGVAGLHRLLAHRELLAQATCLRGGGRHGRGAAQRGGGTGGPAGDRGAHRVGYGASFGGLAALLAMLNSCATGVAVVNIDNGFGAGFLAALINRKD